MTFWQLHQAIRIDHEHDRFFVVIGHGDSYRCFGTKAQYDDAIVLRRIVRQNPQAYGLTWDNHPTH